MRYELRLTAYDMIDKVCVSGQCFMTPDLPDLPSELVWARTETVPGEGISEATEWIREALIVMLEAL